MGLFSKKTAEDIISEGRSLYRRGDYRKALSVLLKYAEEGNPRACLYVGKIYLEQGKKEDAKSYLIKAAEGGQDDAPFILADRLNIRDYLPSPKTA